MTQRERIATYMMEHGSITAKEAMEELGVMRLSAQIFDMKELGMNIKTSMEQSVNRFGDKVRYARYFIAR